MPRTSVDYGPNDPLEGDEGGSAYPDDDFWEDEDEEDESRFVNYALLSHMAVQLRDKVPRGTHVKGSIPYPRAFTGKDIVVSNYRGLVCLILVFMIHSQQFNPKSNESLPSITTSRQAIGGRRCKLHEVFKVNYFSTKSSWAAGCCRMA